MSVEALCPLKSVEVLRLKCLSLTQLPAQIEVMSSLRELCVMAPLRDLPEEIFLLTNLKCLAVSSVYGSIRTIPVGLGQLRKLENLHLELPHLAEIPQSLWNLRKLKHLYASGSASAWASFFEAAARPYGGDNEGVRADDDSDGECPGEAVAQWQGLPNPVLPLKTLKDPAIMHFRNPRRGLERVCEGLVRLIQSN